MEREIPLIMGDDKVSIAGLSIMVSLMCMIAHAYGDISEEEAMNTLQLTHEAYHARIQYARTYGTLYATRDDNAIRDHIERTGLNDV